jgi:hypothetical protein
VCISDDVCGLPHQPNEPAADRYAQHMLGRMNASYRFLTMGMMPLGSVLGGVLGEQIGVRTTLIVGALGIFLAIPWLVRSLTGTLQALDGHECLSETFEGS